MNDRVSDLLAAYDAFTAGKPIAPEQDATATRVALASAYGAAAFAKGYLDDAAAAHAMARAFLQALIDPLHEDLDYLRTDPAAGAIERAKRERPVSANRLWGLEDA